LGDVTPDEEGTVRDVAVSVERDGPFLVVEVRAGGFPRQLVRRLVTAVETVARGRREPAFLDRALEPVPLEGPEGIAPATPEPLVLADVTYPSVAFEVDEPAVAGRRDPGGRPGGGRRMSER